MYQKINFKNIWILFIAIVLVSILGGGCYSAIHGTPDESEEMDLIESGYYDKLPIKWELVFVYKDKNNQKSIMIYYFDSYKNLKDNIDRLHDPEKGILQKLLFKRKNSKDKRYYALKVN